MITTPWHQMTAAERARWMWDHWKLAIPMIVVMLAFMAMTLPIFTPLPAMPNLGLLMVLLWTLYRPQQMPTWSGFLAGLAGDVFLGAPMGANALLTPLFMIAIQAVDERVHRTSWLADWLFSIPAVLLYHLALWKLCGLVDTPIPLLPLMTQAAATLAVYPAVTLLFVWAQRKWAA